MLNQKAVSDRLDWVNDNVGRLSPWIEALHSEGYVAEPATWDLYRQVGQSYQTAFGLKAQELQDTSAAAAAVQKAVASNSNLSTDIQGVLERTLAGDPTADENTVAIAQGLMEQIVPQIQDVMVDDSVALRVENWQQLKNKKDNFIDNLRRIVAGVGTNNVADINKQLDSLLQDWQEFAKRVEIDPSLFNSFANINREIRQIIATLREGIKAPHNTAAISEMVEYLEGRLANYINDNIVEIRSGENKATAERLRDAFLKLVNDRQKLEEFLKKLGLNNWDTLDATQKKITAERIRDYFMAQFWQGVLQQQEQLSDVWDQVFTQLNVQQATAQQSFDNAQQRELFDKFDPRGASAQGLRLVVNGDHIDISPLEGETYRLAGYDQKGLVEKVFGGGTAKVEGKDDKETLSLNFSFAERHSAALRLSKIIAAVKIYTLLQGHKEIYIQGLDDRTAAEVAGVSDALGIKNHGYVAAVSGHNRNYDLAKRKTEESLFRPANMAVEVVRDTPATPPLESGRDRHPDMTNRFKSSL